MASRTRMLCEGAMMCALTALLLLINRVAGGMIETAFPWLLVFPLLVYCARYGVRAALICCVSILLLSLMLCTFTTLFYVFSASLCALVYGSGVRRGAANRSLLLRTGLISFLSNLLSMVVLASLFGYDPAEEAKLLHRAAACGSVDGHALSARAGGVHRRRLLTAADAVHPFRRTAAAWADRDTDTSGEGCA